MKFYVKIQKTRKGLHLSQKNLAEKLGVSRQAITKWERGSSFPKIDKLVALSECLGVSTDYLLKDDFTEPNEANPAALQTGNQ